MNVLPYSTRRQSLLEKIGDGVAVIPAAPRRIRNRDSCYPYRQDSYFWYLSGFPEPDAALVLVGGEKPVSLLFCQGKDETRERWEGFRYGPQAACDLLGFDAAHDFSEIDQRLPDLLAHHSAVWLPLGQNKAWETRLLSALGVVRAKARDGARFPVQMNDLCVPLNHMRSLKDAHEIALMEKAATITSAGHARALRACHPGMTEYALEAEISHEFRRLGANGHAYPPIVAGGANACVLHYSDNHCPLIDGTLVLIDAGCEFENYAADITRTFPVSGRFSAAQRDLYEVVLAAQDAAIRAIAPGAAFNASHEAAVRALTQGMLDLKILAGTLEDLIESEAYKPYYMHRSGHWLGLDVHDAGEYALENHKWIPLAPGMTLTVEPGLYFPPESGVPEAFRGIGIRIEDDVLVTPTGATVYTSVPKSVAEIEDAMRCR